MQESEEIEKKFSQDEPPMDVYSGVRWSVIAKYVSQGIQFVTTIILARLLQPESYGLLGMALVVTGFLKIFRSFGVGTAIVQKKDINERFLNSIYFLNIGIATLLAMILVASSFLFNMIYDDARVGAIISFLSIGFVVSGFGMVSAKLLTRRMAFKRLAITDISVAILKGVVGIALAIGGWEVWALVWSTLSGIAFRTILNFLLCSWRPRFQFSFSEARSVYGFCANITGANLCGYLGYKADSFLVGIYLGAASLGYYTIAMRLLKLPQNTVTALMGRVLLPKLSKYQNNNKKLAELYFKAVESITFIAFPMMLGLTVLAESFIVIALGEKWLPALPVMLILAPLALLQSLDAMRRPLLVAKGKASLVFRLSATDGCANFIGFSIGLNWGIAGVAAGLAIARIAMFLPNYYFVCKAIDTISIKKIFRTVIPHLLSSVCMSAIVFLAHRSMLDAGLIEGISFAVSIVIGITAYSLIAIYQQTPALHHFMKLLPNRMSRPIQKSAIRSG